MTAPTADVPTDAPADDFSLAAALEATAERGSRLNLPDPEPEVAVPAKDAPADAAPTADQPTDAPPPDGTIPDGEVPPADPLAADPFAALVKDAKPLTFRINGAERTHDLILETPHGAVVPADKLGDFRNFVARSESNAEAVKTLLAEREQVERIGGLEKVYESREQFAAINAAGLVLLEAIQNPLSLVALDAQGNVVPNAERIAMIRQTADIARREAVYEARSQRHQAEQTYRSSAQQEEGRNASLAATIDAQFASFPVAEREAAKAYALRDPEAFTFTVTAQNAAQIGQPIGTLMVRAPLIQAYLEERATRPAATAVPTKARVSAEAFNRAVAPPKPAPPARKLPPRNEDGEFVKDKKKERPDASTIFDRARAGKPVSGAASYEDLT